MGSVSLKLIQNGPENDNFINSGHFDNLSL